MTLTQIYLIIKRSFFLLLHESSEEICLSFFCLRSGVAVWGSVNALKMCCTDRILNLMHLSRRVIKDFWRYLESSTEWCSGVLKDCHRFDVFRKNRCCPCGSYKWRWPKWMRLHEIRSQLSALVVIKHHLTNTLFDTPLLMKHPALSRVPCISTILFSLDCELPFFPERLV